MYELYFQKFNAKISLTQDEKEFIKPYLTLKGKASHQQVFVQAGHSTASAIIIFRPEIGYTI